MMAIIKGENRVEYCVIKKRDYDKMLFRHRNQLYIITPDNLVKMRFYDENGHEIRQPEEVAVFQEGA